MNKVLILTLNINNFNQGTSIGIQTKTNIKHLFQSTRFPFQSCQHFDLFLDSIEFS